MKKAFGLYGAIILSIILNAASSAVAESQSDVNIHGYISQGYMKSSDNNYRPTQKTAHSNLMKWD
jgi:hypothetical protein